MSRVALLALVIRVMDARAYRLASVGPVYAPSLTIPARAGLPVAVRALPQPRTMPLASAPSARPARGQSPLRGALRIGLLGAVLATRMARMLASLAWLWLPVGLFWWLPMLEASAAAGNTPLAAAMRGSEALEQLVDMACTTVFLPVVGILYAILVGLTIDMLWNKQAALVEELTADCARTALLVPLLNKAFGASPSMRLQSLRLARGHMANLLGMFGADPIAATVRTTSVGRARRLACAVPGGPEHTALATSLEPDEPSELFALNDMLATAPEPDAGNTSGAEAAFAAASAEVRELVVHACTRSSALRTRLPPVHWATLSGLAASLAYAFWIVATGPSPGAVAATLNCGSLRIRLLFSGLVGAMSFAAKITADLETPLCGQYRIRESDVASLPLLRCAMQDADAAIAALAPTV